MAGYLGSSGNVSGSSTSQGLASLNSTYFNQLINLRLQTERLPITRLETDKSGLTTKRGMFVDMKISLSSLNSAALDLKNTSTSVFTAKSVTSSEPTVVTASGGDDAVTGTSAISVTTLAKAHQILSNPQATTDQALGLTGTFVVGGATSRSVSDPVTVAGTVTGFAVAGSPRTGQTEMGSGTYSVEVLNSEGTYRFRVVDDEGQAVSVAKAGDSSTAMTAGWQDITLVSGTTYDTGRGLAITFGGGDFTTGSRGAGAASVSYVAQGTSITVSSSDSLTRIRGLINAGTYAVGNGVRASIIDRALVLTSATTGAQHGLAAVDGTGTVLQSLGVLSGSSFKTTLQAATDASFTVNGLSVVRSRNSGLDDVIQGVTLGLLQEGEDASASVTVKPDATAITAKVSELLQKLNEVLDYLKDKMQITKNESTGAYTRGGLVGESVFQGLRQGLITALRGKMSGAPSTSMDELADLGVGLDASLHFSVTDSSKLQAGVENNLDGVVALLDNRMTDLTARLAPFTTSTSGVLDSRIGALDTRTKQIDLRVTQIQSRVKILEDQMVSRYGNILMGLSNYNQNQAISNILYTKSMTL